MTGELNQSYPEYRVQIAEKYGGLAEAWSYLKRSAADRKDRLAEAHEVQLFRRDHRDLTAWMLGTKKQIEAIETPTTVEASLATLARHAERKTEIDARADDMTRVAAFGKELSQKGHKGGDELQTLSGGLSAEYHLLGAAWKQANGRLEQARDGLRFERDASAMDAWLATQVRACVCD